VYLNAVAVADGQQLEPLVKKAVNDFVKGCKVDGIWSALKACCLLAGPRTLAGINIPLVGASPTFNAFTSGQYSRETGLDGNGSTMYIDSNRNSTADPQDSQHMAVYVSTFTSGTQGFMGAGGGGNTGASSFGATTSFFHHNRSLTANTTAFASVQGFLGMSRAQSASYTFRANGTTSSFSQASETSHSGSVFVFARNVAGAQLVSNSRLAFYSIGEALDLSRLDTRISADITAIDAAI
jgi:hypothetical protein